MIFRLQSTNARGIICLFAIPVVFLVAVSCRPPVYYPDQHINPSGDPDPDGRYSDTIHPLVVIPDGGLQEFPAPYGPVRYLNRTRSGAESDIRLDSDIAGYQTAKRYLRVSGTAVPDDSGYTDRSYHSVLFKVRKTDDPSMVHDDYLFSLRVDSYDRFSGYLYFPLEGTYSVYAYRYPDDHLYPGTSRGTKYTVNEGSPTLTFTVRSVGTIPESLLTFLPSRAVDSGNLYLIRYAEEIAKNAATELDKAKAVYDFLVRGDTFGRFYYTYYEKIEPGFIDGEYIDVLIASQFLERRTGVCNDFAELYAAMARALGLDVYRATGFIEQPDGSLYGHQWNILVMGGKRYRVDATWGNQSWYATENISRARAHAEFHAEFDPDRFKRTHEDKYTINYVISR